MLLVSIKKEMEGNCFYNFFLLETTILYFFMVFFLHFRINIPLVNKKNYHTTK